MKTPPVLDLGLVKPSPGLVKPSPEPVKPSPGLVKSSPERRAAQGPDFAGTSVPRHLARGAIGFGLVIGSIALVPVAGPAALLAAPLALIAFRGCPTCWMVGLAQTISRGRLERRCVDGVCTLTKAHPHPDPDPDSAPRT